ncbi:hypothetical protein A3E66_04705 [Candidatus Daviesbacteria bacterium RIFCSPHIGHO2_12_FULL_37_16]|uniref:Ribbon-helix-helix protein CopG domain-containing protein n=3 Tax=Candidatus Daviesiibacteriota TaxID=1752718 RepID=A0A0G0H9Z1_9BACT|nr:MAG: hypothetical protein US19_C0018G0021 [Candidatus Daviesbacteria bacterium GW2011_GWB1_36_5]KKQ14172.1 MAG: hypothetical protein US28_C0038G0008 [Candidatus Daviesbacteria bacterium GW2011_GWA1_36_8]OGE31550.1 MAG: hypothetical protein A3C99_02245 [Candidatus Daviesbacteria bacterium RIFCSPHIGHO2_02_FULL_37_9]OGE34879.1 MAG: hypothetical protein A3E66_04705 [Candidatus Daviesbacteria bacterium RIFCSPHIGHO2_12_FULL_37_16]
MKTVNISLTEQQTQMVDQAVNELGFANRSEFFRTLLRVFNRKPEVISDIEDFPMKGPSTKSAKEVLEGFKKVGKYSKGFLKDLEEGLRDSDYFINDLPPK